MPPNLMAMRTEDHNADAIRDAAHGLHGRGYHLVPCAYGGKRPLIPWKHAECSHTLIDRWFDRFGGRLNIAIHAGRSGVVGLDCDRAEAASWVARRCPPSPMSAVTPRGGRHVYFRAPAVPPPIRHNLLGLGLDVKSGPSLLLASPSWSRKHDRRWRWTGEVPPPSELPELPAGLIREEPSPEPKTPPRPSEIRSAGPIRDVTRWIMGVPSVQGEHGSNGCFKVACRLVDAGLPREEAMHWLRAWNARVPRPPWSEGELRHKLTDAFNRRR